MSSELSILLRHELLGNSLKAYGAAALTFAVILTGGLLLRRFLIGRIRAIADSTDTAFDDMLANLLETVTTAELAVIALYAAARSLALGAAAGKAVHVLFVVALTWRAVTWIKGLLSFTVRKTTERAGLTDAHASSAIHNLQFFLNGAIWTAAALFVLDNLGVNITAAVAGLGIGGIAVAMAAQQIFKDLFSSLVIYIDQPFKVGDFIIVGDMMGAVDHVGIKTTRVRSLSGEMLVFPNSDLTSSRIRNYKLMEKRRVAFNFRLVYETPLAKVRIVADTIRKIFKGIDKAKLERVHFKALAAYNLDFEVVYHVLSGDYNLYMDIQERVNLEMLGRFEEAGIRFAIPAQTVHLNPGTAPTLEKAAG